MASIKYLVLLPLLASLAWLLTGPFRKLMDLPRAIREGDEAYDDGESRWNSSKTWINQ